MAGILSVGSIKNGYEIYKMISADEQGGFSVSALAKKDGFDYFLKMYHSPTKVSPPDRQEYFKNRIFKLMGKLGIAKIKNFIAQDKEFFLDEESGRYIKISELLTGKQLQNFLASEPYNNKGLTYDEALKYATLIAFAFKNIHEYGITHCDLKPDNIFIEERETMGGGKTKSIVIIDFDSAIIDDLPKPTELVGTPGYYSIEHLIHDHVDENIWPSMDSDVFTLGIIFYELLTGQKPFPGKSSDGSLNETALIILNENKMPKPLNEIKSEVSKELSDIIISMLNADRKIRPTIKDIHQALISLSSGDVPKTVSTLTDEVAEITKPVEKTSATSYLDSELGDIDSTSGDKIKPVDTAIAADSDLSTASKITDYKLVGPSGEIILDKNTGISQINSRSLGLIGVKTSINSGRLYFDKGDNKWKFNASKFVDNNLLINNVPIKKESIVNLNAGDKILLDKVQFIFTGIEQTIDKEELIKAEKDLSKKNIDEHIKNKVKDAKDLTLKCGEKKIEIKTVSTFILSSRNLMDFELYSIKNLGSISVDTGVWKIYPSKFSENSLKLNNEFISTPTALAPGDIINIEGKDIEVIY